MQGDVPFDVLEHCLPHESIESTQFQRRACKLESWRSAHPERYVRVCVYTRESVSVCVCVRLCLCVCARTGVCALGLALYRHHHNHFRARPPPPPLQVREV